MLQIRWTFEEVAVTGAWHTGTPCYSFSFAASAGEQKHCETACFLLPAVITILRTNKNGCEAAAFELHMINMRKWIFFSFLRPFSVGRSDEACVRFLNFPIVMSELATLADSFEQMNSLHFYLLALSMLIPYSTQSEKFIWFLCYSRHRQWTFRWRIQRAHMMMVGAGMMACRRFHSIHCYFSFFPSMTLDFVNIHNKNRMFGVQCVNPLINFISADFVPYS